MNHERDQNGSFPKQQRPMGIRVVGSGGRRLGGVAWLPITSPQPTACDNEELELHPSRLRISIDRHQTHGADEIDNKVLFKSHPKSKIF